MGHIAFDIVACPDKVKDALLKRNLNAREDTGATAESPAAEHDIHTATHKSYHTTTPNGYDLQISYRAVNGKHHSPAEAQRKTSKDFSAASAPLRSA